MRKMDICVSGLVVVDKNKKSETIGVEQTSDNDPDFNAIIC